MQGIGQRLVNETNLFYNDKAHYFKQLLPDASSMVTWKDVESCMNRPELYNFEMIGPDNLKIEIPMNKKAWVFAKPVQDKAFMFEKLHQGCGFVIMDYAFHSEKTIELMRILENIYMVNSAIHVYGGLSDSKSFWIHEDYPSNFIIQAEGKTRWKVFHNRISSMYQTGTMNHQLKEEDLDIALDVVLEPGDALYIPSRAYHIAEPMGKRLSMSVPCWTKIPTDDPKESSDRNWYRINYDSNI